MKILGDKIALAFKTIIKSGGKDTDWSGKWVEGAIEIAINSVDALGVARHEAAHQLMSWLRQAKAEGVEEVLKNVATNHTINRQLHRLLKDHPEAIKQLAAPEEATAYSAHPSRGW